MTKAALTAAILLLALAPAADAKAKRLTGRQLVAAGNSAAADLERAGETVRPGGTCRRVAARQGGCRLTLERAGEPGNATSDIEPGTCFVGVTVVLRKGRVLYSVDFASRGRPHVTGWCEVRS